MCRNIKTIYNFDPPATDTEIRDAALQFVRKVSGFRIPSKTNTFAFTQAVNRISSDITELLQQLKTTAPPKNRDAEMQKLHQRAVKRFGQKN